MNLVFSSRTHRGESPESGQATIEFALTLIFLLSLVFFYVQLGLVMAVGNYVQYATYMAARAYYSAGPDQDDQIERATRVLTKMLKKNEGDGADRWPTIVKGQEGDQLAGVRIGRGNLHQDKDKAFSWQEGVRYSFRSRIFLLPGARGEASSAMELSSESWLGRESNYSECSEYMTNVGGIFDNGC